MQAGLMRGRPNLEALEMELREEMIREEIIARRIAQRRMMEEQAKREMEIATAMSNAPQNGQKISHFGAGEGTRRFGPLRGRGDYVPKVKPVAKLEEITDSDTKMQELSGYSEESKKLNLLRHMQSMFSETPSWWIQKTLDVNSVCNSDKSVLLDVK